MIETLECGRSLAEREHQGTIPPPPTQNQKISYNNVQKEGEIEKKSDTEKEEEKKEEEKKSESSPQKRTTSINDAIESLRSSIASDTLCNSHNNIADNTSNSNNEDYNYNIFASPFEVPNTNLGQKQPQKQQQHASRQYLELPMVYCDQTASNRHVKSIEEYLTNTCYPLYGNTHTNISITGSQSTAFVSEARQIVAEAVNAKITGKASLDVVLFAGSGATAAVELLIDCLGLKHYAASESDDNSLNHRPVVFVGPYEHHSNLLPWRESGCEIVMIPEHKQNKTIDYDYLENVLKSPKYLQRTIKMGTFSAASNITGIVSDTKKLASLLHKYNALAFFDYATGAPYLDDADMNPTDAAACQKDAIFVSPHKMIGGVGTPGILVVKKHLINQNNPPKRSGGGTVFYVTHDHHRFLSNRIERNEGGTPDIPGIMRVGLTFLFKRKIQESYQRIINDNDGGGTTNGEKNNHSIIPKTIMQYEYNTYNHSVHYLKQNAPNLVLLSEYQINNNDAPHDHHHLPILSFLIRCGNRFLHYNYVCALLNDVFGIQSRGGCQCAGPYSQKILGLTKTTSKMKIRPNRRNKQIENALLNHKERSELLRPGFTRISLPFKGLHKYEVDYVLSSLSWVSQNGWKLMCQYRCNHRTGEWRHSSRQGKPLGKEERKWLSHYEIVQNRQSNNNVNNSKKPVVGKRELLDRIVSATANDVLNMAVSDQSSIKQTMKMVGMGDDNMMTDDDDNNEDAILERLRWFVYPKECAWHISQGHDEIPGTTGSWDNILGAIRPLASCGISNDDDDDDDSDDEENDENFISCCSSSKNNNSTTNTSSTDKKRKSLSATLVDDVAVAGVDDDYDSTMKTMAQPPLQTTTNIGLVSFRDGENHSGEAPLDEIVTGYDEGELSEECEMFDKKQGKWILVAAAAAAAAAAATVTTANFVDSVVSSTPSSLLARTTGKKPRTTGTPPLSKTPQSSSPPQHRVINTDAIISFRDGENHSGEARMDEILAGYEEGELSENCEMFDQGKEKWVLIASVVAATAANENASNNNKNIAIVVEDILHSAPHINNNSNIDNKKKGKDEKQEHVDLKNQKKKPSRDSSMWGQAQFRPTKIAAESVDKRDKKSSSNDNATTNHPGTVAPSLLNANDPAAIVAATVGSANSVVESQKGKKKPRFKHVKPPAKIMRTITQAMIQWDMIQEGDRLLLGLSGGKDSLSLLHCLLEFKRKLPIKFDLEVCTIDPMTPSFDPSPLIPYVENLGLKYHYIRDNIVARANSAGKDGKIVSSLCAFCARMKRGNLYTCARENNCNKLILAQHLDDCAESFFMSVMHNGFLRTMKANYRVNAGDISVIRPLVYCREGLLTEFAKTANLPVINENCPACFEEPKERARIKKLLSREETLYTNFYDNLRRSLIPLMHDDTTAILRCYTEQAIAKSRKVPFNNSNKKGKGKGKNSNNNTKSIEEKDQHQKFNRSKDDNEDDKDHSATAAATDTTNANSFSSSATATTNKNQEQVLLAEATEEELIIQLAKKRAERFRLSGAMKVFHGRKNNNDNDVVDDDPTGQVCTLNGGNGSIPCSELME